QNAMGAYVDCYSEDVSPEDKKAGQMPGIDLLSPLQFKAHIAPVEVATWVNDDGFTVLTGKQYGCSLPIPVAALAFQEGIGAAGGVAPKSIILSRCQLQRFRDFHPDLLITVLHVLLNLVQVTGFTGQNGIHC